MVWRQMCRKRKKKQKKQQHKSTDNQLQSSTLNENHREHIMIDAVDVYGLLHHQKWFIFHRKSGGFLSFSHFSSFWCIITIFSESYKVPPMLIPHQLWQTFFFLKFNFKQPTSCFLLSNLLFLVSLMTICKRKFRKCKRSFVTQR